MQAGALNKLLGPPGTPFSLCLARIAPYVPKVFLCISPGGAEWWHRIGPIDYASNRVIQPRRESLAQRAIGAEEPRPAQGALSQGGRMGPQWAYATMTADFGFLSFKRLCLGMMS